jgi:hypothetical protein
MSGMIVSIFGRAFKLFEEVNNEEMKRRNIAAL